jgi:hypothetical protein
MAGDRNHQARMSACLRALAAVASVVSAILLVLPPVDATTAPPSGQGGIGGAGTTPGGFEYDASGDVVKSGSASSGLVTQTFDCGPPVPVGHLLSASDFCGQVHNSCAGDPLTNAAGQPLTTYASRTMGADGFWSLLSIDCTVVAGPAPVPAAAAQASFIKLLPHLSVSSAPPNGRSLVNAESLFWIPTANPLNLGSATLLGHRVTLTATVASVRWNFGDSTTATTNGPGRPFLASDHCATLTCPGWFGHTYTTPAAHLSVPATITWTGTYNVDGGVELSIPATVTTTPPPTTVTVVQARSVLVPN